MPRVMHFEIVSNDPNKTKEFYEAVFGWKFTQLGGQAYWKINTGESSQPGIKGGLTGPRGPGPSRMTNTIDVPSIEDASQKIKAKGGEVYDPPGKVEVNTDELKGYLAICKDNEGIVFGIFQEDPNVK